MLDFDFLEMGLGLVSPPHFVLNFSTKIFSPGCDVTNFETNLIFLIKPFSYMTKKSRQNIKCLESQKSFYGEIKNIFHHIKKICIKIDENCLRPRSELLSFTQVQSSNCNLCTFDFFHVVKTI